MKRSMMAVVLIVAGLFCLFCEVTVTHGRNYSVKVTVVGSKLEVHNYEEIKDRGTDLVILNGIGGRSLADVLDKMLSGEAHTGELYFATKMGPVSGFRSLADLVIPVLPEGCEFEDNMSSVAWSDQGFSFDFAGEMCGCIYVTDQYSDKHWGPYYEDREYRKAGNWKVYENDRGDVVTVVGKRGQNRFYVILRGSVDSISDEMLAQFDLEKYVSAHPKVLMFYEVHALRLLGMAAAASGGILLLCQIRRLREKAEKQKAESYRQP